MKAEPSRHIFSAASALALVMAAILGAASPAAANPGACVGRDAIGIARTVEIDPAGGGLYGSMTAQTRMPSFLAKNEVVLTFDDGPVPWITGSILDTLDRFCTRAMFFAVGRMAVAYPGTIRQIAERGHTLGSHTFTHPYRLGRMPAERAHDEIERGIAAVAAAAESPVAPFFRFTGLNDSAPLLDYLASRHIASFTVDVVSNDSYIADADTLASRTLAEVEARGGGIILFHDIKASTAEALPKILTELKVRGFKVVHVTAKTPAQPRLDLLAEIATKIAAKVKRANVATLTPFYGSVGPDRAPARRDVSLDANDGVAGAHARRASRSRDLAYEPALQNAWEPRVEPAAP